MATMSTRCYLAHHAFNVLDSEIRRTWDGSWSSVDYETVGVADGVVTLFSPRAAGNAPVAVEVREEPPPDDLGDASQIVEASLTTASGRILVTGEQNDESEPPLVVELAPGSYRLRAYASALETCEYDGDTGDDHYRNVFWPALPAEPAVLRRFEPRDD